MKPFTPVALLFAALATTGCASGEKPLLSRGWIGGEYESYRISSGLTSLAQVGADVADIDDRCRAVLVTQSYASTPARASGLEEGDLIVAVDSQPVTSKRALYARLDDTAPGDALHLTVLRDGAIVRPTVRVGEEKYRVMTTLSLGLGLSSKLDLIPNPDFSVLGLLRFGNESERLELRSPRLRPSGPSQRGVKSREGWDVFLGIIGLGRSLDIVSQEATHSNASASL